MSHGIVTNPAGPGGADMTPYLITPLFGTAAAVWPSANQGIYVRFRVNKARTVAGLRIGVAVASGSAKVGLFSSDGTTATQIVLSASTSVAGTNVTQDIAFTASAVCVPFQDYFALLACDNTTASFLRSTIASGGFTGAGAFECSYAVSTQFTTPTTPLTIAGLTGSSSGYTPVIALI